MRRRGPQFWLWVNKKFPTRIHEERLKDGRYVEVQARVMHNQVVQVFVGIYQENGAPMHEEFHDREGLERLSSALKWGLQRALAILMESEPFCAPHRTRFTLGPVITDDAVLALRRREMTEQEQRKLDMLDADAEYVSAKMAMLTLMRSTSVDAHAWDAHRARLQQAIDRKISLLRTYLL
jgi:hypothetical protein